MINLNQPKTYRQKLINFIILRTTPQGLTVDDGIIYWQERLLLVFVFAGTFLGVIAYLPSLVLSIREDLWSVAVADTIIYGWVVFLYLNPSISFQKRAVSIVLISYIIGIILLLIVQI